MEGYLGLWTGVLSQWRKFYFILHNDILTFCSDKGGEKEGSVHLKVASIVSVIDDPLKINIHTGTHILFIRAETVNQRIEWMKAVSAAQQEMFTNDLSLQMRKLESDGARQYDIVDRRVKNIDMLVAQVWNSQAELDDLLTQLMPRLQRNNTSSRLCEKIIQSTNNIKYKTSDAINIIKQLKTSYIQKPTSIRQQIDYYPERLKINSQDSIPNLFPMKNNSISIDQYKSFDKGYELGGINNASLDQYQSFDKIPGGRSLERINQISHQSSYKSFDKAGPYVPLKLFNKASEDSDYSMFQDFGSKGALTSIPTPNHFEKCSNPYKNTLIRTNTVFINYPLSKDKYRTSLPVGVSPDLKINIMSILKDSIGADLTKISLPVSLNQPLSVLQKGAQQMYYSSLLDQANSFEDPIDRLLYVIAFTVSQYSLTINKTKKPFNPLLGQTYQYIDERRKFKYLSEQVSHHPPVSATQCSSQNYQYFTNSKGSTNFRGASIKMIPESLSRIILKKHKDTIVFNKCTTSLNNLIVGTLYVDNYGDITFKMTNGGQTIATADIKFLQCSMWGNTQYKVTGTVKNNKGRQYKIQGKWNQSLSYSDGSTTKEIWNLTHRTIPDNYYFNELATDLNNLNADLLNKISPTDSRLRPDQRALQYGQKDLAASQKNRLQQKQRQRRKIMQSQSQHHHPVWFVQTIIPQSGQKQWVSNSKYWQQRNLQNWSNSLQIF